MAFSTWLAAHTPGWPIFLAATTFLSVSVAVARVFECFFVRPAHFKLFGHNSFA